MKKTFKKPSLLAFLAVKNQKLENFIQKNYIDSEKSLYNVCNTIGVAPPNWNDIKSYLENLNKKNYQPPQEIEVKDFSNNIIENKNEVIDELLNSSISSQINDGEQQEKIEHDVTTNEIQKHQSKTVDFIQNKRQERQERLKKGK